MRLVKLVHYNKRNIQQTAAPVSGKSTRRAGMPYHVSQEKGLRMNNQYQPQVHPELASDEQDRLNKIRRILDAAQAKYSILFNADTVHSADDGVIRDNY
jgi:hypothetical protein